MMLVFPVAELPKMVMPLLVGRSDERCSRISRNSHFRPTKVRGPAAGDLGTSKKSGLSRDESWVLLTKLSTTAAEIEGQKLL